MSKERPMSNNDIYSQLCSIVDLCGYSSSDVTMSSDCFLITTSYSYKKDKGNSLVALNVEVTNDTEEVINCDIFITISIVGVTYNLRVLKNKNGELAYSVERDFPKIDGSNIECTEPWSNDFNVIAQKIKYFIGFPSTFYTKMQEQNSQNHIDNGSIENIPLNMCDNEITTMLIKFVKACGADLSKAKKINESSLEFSDSSDTVSFMFYRENYDELPDELQNKKRKSDFGSASGTINGINFFIEYGREEKKGFAKSYKITLDKDIGDNRISFAIRNDVIDGKVLVSTSKVSLSNGDVASNAFGTTVADFDNILEIVKTIVNKPYETYLEFQELSNKKTVSSADGGDFYAFASVLGIDISKCETSSGIANDENSTTVIYGSKDNLSFSFTLWKDRLTVLSLTKQAKDNLRYIFEVRLASDNDFVVYAWRMSDNTTEVSATYQIDSLSELLVIIRKINEADLSSIDEEIFNQPAEQRGSYLKELLNNFKPKK